MARRTQALQSQTLYRLLIERQDVLWRTDNGSSSPTSQPGGQTPAGLSDEVLGALRLRDVHRRGVRLSQEHASAPGDRGCGRQFRGSLRFRVEHRCKDNRLI